MPSLLDIFFDAETQHLLGIVSILTATIGLLLWAAGIKIARLSVALVLGLCGAVVASSQLPHDLDLSPVTSAILGFVGGALLGAITFRFLQGAVLAASIGLAVAGSFYQWHNTASQPTAQIASTATGPFQGVGPNASLADELNKHYSAPKAQDLTIPLNRFSTQSPTTSHAHIPALTAFKNLLASRWNTLPQPTKNHILLASLGSAVCALLLALTYPKPTTWIFTALLGSFLLLESIHTLAHIYTPQYELYFPASHLSRYLTLALLTSIGLLLQYKFFWPPTSRPNPLPHLQNPLYQGPLTGSSPVSP